MEKQRLHCSCVLISVLTQTLVLACGNRGDAGESAAGIGGKGTAVWGQGGATATPQGGASTRHETSSGAMQATAGTSSVLAQGTSTGAGGATSAGSTGVLITAYGGASTAMSVPLANGGATVHASSAASIPKSGAAGSSFTSGGKSGTAVTPVAGTKSMVGGATSTGGTKTAAAGGASGGARTSSSSASSPIGGTVSGGATNTPASQGAAETSATGYGKTATGGGSVAAKECATLAALQSAVDDYSGTGGLVLKYTGTFDFASISDPCTQHTRDAQVLEIKNLGNITILGADGSSANFGVRIVGASSNVIVRNMTIGLTPGGDASDMISIEGNSTGAPSNVWVDHNSLFSSMVECDGAGDTEFDGMIDIKKGADNITISYNHMHDHHKVSLNGHSDSTETNQHVTYHHNLFENVGARTPLQRFGYSHLFNNLFYNVMVSAINVRMGGYSLVEANYFENVANPVTSRDSDEIGYWELRDNNLASAADVVEGNQFGITWTPGDSGTVNAIDWATTKKYPIALDYTYTAQPFQCVRAGLRAVVGAGKKLATLACK